MDNFRKTLQQRMGLAVLYNAIILMILALGIFHLATGNNEEIEDLIAMFSLGLCVGIQSVMIYNMGKIATALKDEEKLKALYITEKDERSHYINGKTSATGINIVIITLLLGAVVSGYFNEMVFFTLTGAMLFTLIVKLVLAFVYSKKY